MHDDLPPADGLFALPPRTAELLLGECADLTLRLSADFRVLDVIGSAELPAAGYAHWIGRPLTELVAPDSRAKLERLFDENAAERPGARWRHVNFLDDGMPSLPLLLKFFRFSGTGRALHLICARDLRPVMSVQRSFQRELLAQQAHDEDAERRHRGRIDGYADVLGAIRAAEARPGDDAVGEALRRIERLCIEETLQQCDGDAEAAAALLGLSVEALNARRG